MSGIHNGTDIGGQQTQSSSKGLWNDPSPCPAVRQSWLDLYSQNSEQGRMNKVWGPKQRGLLASRFPRPTSFHTSQCVSALVDMFSSSWNQKGKGWDTGTLQLKHKSKETPGKLSCCPAHASKRQEPAMAVTCWWRTSRYLDAFSCPYLCA